LLAVLVLATACATTAVDMSEERRVVGTENGVRLDAQIKSDALSTQNSIPFTYDVTNDRALPIAIADMVPTASYDAEAGLVTVILGSEVPGANLLPRLIPIAPGAKKTFSGVIRLHVLPPSPGDPRGRPLRLEMVLKLNFLSDVQPFAQLVDIQQKAVNDPQLADRLFPLWLERNEILLTGSVPMRWRAPVESDTSAARGR
jgi:hypothetical protein